MANPSHVSQAVISTGAAALRPAATDSAVTASHFGQCAQRVTILSAPSVGVSALALLAWLFLSWMIWLGIFACCIDELCIDSFGSLGWYTAGCCLCPSLAARPGDGNATSIISARRAAMQVPASAHSEERAQRLALGSVQSLQIEVKEQREEAERMAKEDERHRQDAAAFGEGEARDRQQQRDATAGRIASYMPESPGRPNRGGAGPDLGAFSYSSHGQSAEQVDRRMASPMRRQVQTLFARFGARPPRDEAILSQERRPRRLKRRRRNGSFPLLLEYNEPEYILTQPRPLQVPGVYTPRRRHPPLAPAPPPLPLSQPSFPWPPSYRTPSYAPTVPLHYRAHSAPPIFLGPLPSHAQPRSYGY